MSKSHVKPINESIIALTRSYVDSMPGLFFLYLPPGSAKFANAAPPGLTGKANAPQQPGVGGTAWAQVELTDALVVFLRQIFRFDDHCISAVEGKMLTNQCISSIKSIIKVCTMKAKNSFQSSQCVETYTAKSTTIIKDFQF